MSKIQIYQLIAITLLIIFVVYSYQTDVTITWLFYLLAFINVTLWILRLLERRKKEDL
ncbi:hypothetical protein [Halalkalibacter akibai]|uniref:Uncharacterized protein n=1 Tax=Halalkalibacter akibai (strain ATCC 43226 / DSM 21942 / CIP 109018 / JCM 9157 / 1139) TaxID=1236973 RepID=W4QU90_HALA3|nr:hypothetical protein [Halalkalibacter akibai]GAE35457.1 hypothetical protein JCM9157_2563 [Halalkalibacter akibai JCM 9157]